MGSEEFLGHGGRGSGLLTNGELGRIFLPRGLTLLYILDYRDHYGGSVIPYKNIQGVPKKVGNNNLVWFIMIWLILIVLYGLEANPGNSHQSSSDPGLVRVRPNSRALLCLCCCQIRAAEQPLYTTLSAGTRWMVLTSHDF